MHMGELSFPLVHAFQANHSPTDQIISPLLSTRDPISLDHRLKDNTWFLLDF